jgi:hypothetical protein
MISLVRIVAALVANAFRLVLLLLRSSATIRAENLVLRKQLGIVKLAKQAEIFPTLDRKKIATQVAGHAL